MNTTLPKSFIGYDAISQAVDKSYSFVLSRMRARGMQIQGLTPETTKQMLYDMTMKGEYISDIIPAVGFEQRENLRAQISEAVDRDFNGVRDRMYQSGIHVAGLDNVTIKNALFEMALTGKDISNLIK
jgi:hypothetical protein